MKPSIKDNAPDLGIFLICPGGVGAKERERELKEENAGGAMRLKPWLVQQGPMSWAQRHWSEGHASGDKGAIDYNFLSCSKNFF